MPLAISTGSSEDGWEGGLWGGGAETTFERPPGIPAWVPGRTAEALGVKTMIAAPIAITKNNPAEIATNNNFLFSMPTSYIIPKRERISSIRFSVRFPVRSSVRLSVMPPKKENPELSTM